VRRLLAKLALLACLAPAALAGCGGGDDESPGALDAGLAQLPKEAPLAVAIDTDLEGDQYKALDSILGKFPLEASSVRELLRDQIGGGGSNIDFESDIEPILGNPLVIGATDVASLSGSSEAEDLVITLRAKDKGALDDLIEKTGPEETGEVAGATKYKDSGTNFAVEDDLVVIAPSEEELDEALERADGDDHLDTDTFEAGLDGLPGSALARVYADLGALLASQPGGERARRLEWLGALRTLGLTATARDDRVEVEFNLRTDPEGLTDGDLPIATGDESPPVITRDGEIGFGIRDPAHIVRFAEAAGQAIDPSGFADYARAKETLDARLDISIDDDLIGQLTGDLSGASRSTAALASAPGSRIQRRSRGRSPRSPRCCRALPRGRASAPSRSRSPTAAKASTPCGRPTATGSSSASWTACWWWPTALNGHASSPPSSPSRSMASRARSR
jgi:hypothetical protein